MRDREIWRDRIKWGRGHREMRGQRDTGVYGARVRMCGVVALPKPVPQRVQLPVHGLGGLCDILQLVLQPPADCLGPGRLLLSLLQLPLQLLHSKVPLLQLGVSRGAGSFLWVLPSPRAPHSSSLLHPDCPVPCHLFMLCSFLLDPLTSLHLRFKCEVIPHSASEGSFYAQG